jgi:tRNA(fMet)-specific endonuclease VapC
MSPKTLLDSDILSAIMRREAKALTRSRQYLVKYSQLSFSLITRFEILRGLKAKRATAGVERFEKFCATCEILSVTDEIVVLASEIYAELYQQGQLIGDADILIAATAIANGLDLATNNTSHFTRVPGLRVDNWLQ